MKKIFVTSIFVMLAAATSFAADGSVTSPAPAVATSSWRDQWPNALGLDITSETTHVDLNKRAPITTEPRTVDGEYNEFTKYFGSVSFSRLLINEDLVRTGSSWAWSPSFNLAYNRVNFKERYAFLRETDFNLFRLNLGYGPTWNFISRYGVFYAQIAPGAIFSSVAWSSPVDGGDIHRFYWNLSGTLGFYKQVHKDFAVRVFAKYIREDTQLWDTALDHSQGFNVPVDSVDERIVGLSLCYLTPDFLN